MNNVVAVATGCLRWLGCVMTTRNLNKIFDPKRIAVIGADDSPDSLGSVALHNLIAERGDRVVYPVNPERESVHGIQAYPDLASVPNQPDLAVICVEPGGVPDTVRQCGESGILGVAVLSTGFREAGAAGEALIDRTREVARAFPDMRILGPNSFGVVVPRLGLNASQATGLPKQGHVAFVTQSQAISVSMLDRALREHVGFSHFVSIGSGIDINLSDLIDYLGGDPWTQALILYVMSIDDVREFMSAARAFARNKPIVAYKSGRFAETTAGALLHTGQMAGEDAVFDAALERAGIVRVSELQDLFECAELLARQRTPSGDRLAIISNAGEPAGVAADALLDRHGVLAPLAPATNDQLSRLVLETYPYTNPAHLARCAKREEYAEATRLVLKDPNVDAALVILVPRGTTDPMRVAEAIADVAADSRKPVLACWMGGQAVQSGIQVLNESNVPAYTAPEQAVRAFMYLVTYARNRESLYETPRDISVLFTQRRGRLGRLMLQQTSDVLSERISKAVLRSYGIPATKSYLTRTADEAVERACQIGFPVVLKLFSPQVTFKTEIGGVATNLSTEVGVRAHFEQIVASARHHRPDAQIEGITVQKMVDAPDGVELIMGSRRDPTFGSILMVGAGGIATRVIHDRALGLPPVNERLARRMLESLNSWPLLLGYRGQPGVNIERVIDILMRLSYLVADHPEICELDINPLLATPDRVVALDARIRIDHDAPSFPGRSYSHLAIRPYPAELVQQTRLRDGTSVTMRPIRPEDEPAWQELLARCSDESIRLRFRAILKRSAHEVATRYCFVDYDREMAIVAKIDGAARPTIIGMGNLFGEPDGESAEYAVLVADDWQNKGLGATLTNYCLRIARNWGRKSIYAETTKNNQRMISLFVKLGFQIDHQTEEEVLLTKNLD